jgi:hypothetical protein
MRRIQPATTLILVSKAVPLIDPPHLLVNWQVPKFLIG